jgi:hypothetical protein
MAEKTVQDWMASQSAEGQALEENAIIRDLASRKKFRELQGIFADHNRY